MNDIKGNGLVPIIAQALEVMEAMDILKGKQSHLRDLCIEVSTKMVSMAKGISMEDAEKQVLENLNSGKAYDKFLEFVKAQGGDINGINPTYSTSDAPVCSLFSIFTTLSIYCPSPFTG